MTRLRASATGRWVEPAFATVIGCGMIYSLWHLWDAGYLPQPFFYDPADIWGDWFNVAYWAYDKGTYDAWGSLYPPMSFVFLRIFSLSHCYPVSGGGIDGSAGLPARSCDWLGLLTAHAIYVIDVLLVATAFYRNDRRTSLWRSFGLMCSLPMLEAFEHTNLVMTGFLFFVLAFGPLLKSARLRWLAIGMAINFKVYLIASIFPQLLRRRWLWFEGALLTTVLLYLGSFALLGRGTLVEIYHNIDIFTSGQSSRLLDIWFAATYLPTESLLDNWQSPMMGLIGSHNVDLALFMIRLTRGAVQATILLAAAATWLRPETVSRYRLTNLGVSLALISTESGGYTPIFVFFLTFMEPWAGFGRKWAIVASYVLCIPLDIPIQRATTLVQGTFFPSHTVVLTYWVMLGPFVRPVLFLSVPFALCCVTLRTVWSDVRARGWRERLRYRGDYPLLTDGGQLPRPVTPARTSPEAGNAAPS